MTAEDKIGVPKPLLRTLCLEVRKHQDFKQIVADLRIGYWAKTDVGHYTTIYIHTSLWKIIERSKHTQTIPNHQWMIWREKHVLSMQTAIIASLKTAKSADL